MEIAQSMPDYDWGLLAFCLAVVAIIIGIHLRLAVRLWDRANLLRSLGKLAALSIGMAFIWYIVGLVIALPFGLSPHASHVWEYIDIIAYTVGLPWGIHDYVEWLPNLPGSLGYWSYGIYGCLVVALFLYLLGLLVASIIPRTRKTTRQLL
jgi:hypothetical protein